ncbi:MAG: tetratricopeptide repeat protein [Ferruginibacter sp.]
MRSIVIIFLCLPVSLAGQKQKADSLLNLLSMERTDTGKVKLMWQAAGVINVYDPESALSYAQKALALATDLKYTEGQSKSLGALANTFSKMGNHSKALELNLRKLKLEEKGNNPLNLAYALMNIGIVYRYQEEYSEALKYYYRSDSVIRQNNLEDAKYYINMMLGDVYDRINNNDSAFSYFNRSLIISNNLKNDDFIGNSMTGLGHTYFKQGNAPFSLLYYHSAIKYLQAANDDDVLCEALLGLATLYQQLLHKNDSAVYYASLSLQIAEKDGFITKQLDAVNFLSNHYKTMQNFDSAYVYLNKMQQLNDSINSKEKIRELQMMSSNENFRQLEIEENKKIARKERKQQLQLLFIGFFIPGFFLLTLLLSRIRIHSRVIKILGILSLLILFEYLTLLLHPTVAAFTNHTPVYEMFIFVAIAAILIPGHHRIENWLIEKLIHRKGSIKLKKIKFTVKAPKDDQTEIN